MKYLLDKYKVFESFNPVLDGTFIPPSNSNVTCDEPFELPDRPAWLESDIDDGSGDIMYSDVLSIGSILFNGEPMTSWSAQRIGNSTLYNKKKAQQNWIYLHALQQSLFPNGIQAYLKSEPEFTNLSITKVKILKMVKGQNNIGFTIHLNFLLNDTEIWGKFTDVGINTKPEFYSNDLIDLPIELKLKTKGQLWRIIMDWFKIKPGVYRCLADTMLVYNDFGQLKKLVKDNIIEVIYSDETKIKLIINNKEHHIKVPEYFWFNWMFEKVK
jgi:hypothetical protein